MSKNTEKTLNLYPIDYPFETLYHRVKAKKLDLDPEFQRKYKWNKDGKEDRTSRFIESCLLRIPLPACYFAETEDGKHYVIDGVQRITTVVRFMDNEFALEGLETFDELNGKKFKDLAPNIKAELENYTIRCIVLRHDNSSQIVQDIFARLNQGAVLLSPQEIRHALYPGSLDLLLQELAKISEIKNFRKGKEGKKEKDGREAEEQILRFFAMRGDLSEVEDKLSKRLNKFMKDNQNLSDEEITKLREVFVETLEKCKLVFGDKAFINPTRRIQLQSLALFDLLMWSLEPYPKGFLNGHKNQIVEKFAELCREPSFQKTLSGGTQREASVVQRRKLWQKKLDEISS
jgi:hypothetical protein